MTSTELERAAAEGQGAIQLLLDLEAEGKADEVSLQLSDPEMRYDTWEALGRFLGSLARRSNWWVGDWLNFGEALFGEAASQGVEATTAERYSEAERVTGLEHSTLMNIRSVCGKVARTRRRAELGFWIHAEVAPLEPAEQEEWLQRAIDESWTRSQLRDAIREAKTDTEPPGPEPAPSEPSLTLAERLEAAARSVFRSAQPTSDGSFLVPGESMARLREALGEE